MKMMLCATDRHRREKRRISSKSNFPLAASVAGSQAPPGCTAAALDKTLRGIRWRLDAVSYGTLREPRREVPRLVETLRRSTEWLVWGERHDDAFFDLFCEHSMLAGFVTALRVHGSPKVVKLQVLQSLSILLQNSQRETSLIYLLSGGLLNTFFDYPPDLEDEEMLAYFVTLLKGLVLRLDEGTALLCLVAHDACSVANSAGSQLWSFSDTQKRMPAFECAVHLIGHSDAMVQTAARTVVLCILRIDQPMLRVATEEASMRLLVPSLVDLAYSSGFSASSEDLLGFVGDIYRLDIPAIRTALESEGFSMNARGCVDFDNRHEIQTLTAV